MSKIALVQPRKKWESLGVRFSFFSYDISSWMKKARKAVSYLNVSLTADMPTFATYCSTSLKLPYFRVAKQKL